MVLNKGASRITMSNGDVITAAKTPDFSHGTQLEGGNFNREKLINDAVSKNRKTVIGYCIFGGIWLAAALGSTAVVAFSSVGVTAVIVTFAGFVLLPSVVFVSQIIKSSRIVSAMKEGSIEIYSFQATGKFSRRDSEGDTDYFITFGGINVKVDYTEFSRADAGKDVYCAAVYYKDKCYFCYLGNELPDMFDK